MDKTSWNRIIAEFPAVTILQTWEWGSTKGITGWEPDFYIRKNSDGWIEAASLVLSREERIFKFGPKLKILYLPHGPLTDWTNEDLIKSVLNELVEYAKNQKAIYLKIDPQVIVGNDQKEKSKEHPVVSKDFNNWMKVNGWRKSPQQIQFKNTFWINLEPSEEQLLTDMKQKTRYNIRLSERKGIFVKSGGIEDLDLLYEMYLETSDRDGFIIRPREYYKKLWGEFFAAGMAIPLIAMFEDTPVAALILFHFGDKSYYLYGMSKDLHREKMPNYLLQWEAIKISKQLGCKTYDLWGAPDTFDESDRMWGVYRFKEGLGGKVIQTIGAYDYPTSKFTYTIIQSMLPLIQKFTRLFRKKQIRDELDHS